MHDFELNIQLRIIVTNQIFSGSLSSDQSDAKLRHKNDDILTTGYMFKIIRSVRVRKNILGQLDSRGKFCLQNIDLVQEENKSRLLQ